MGAPRKRLEKDGASIDVVIVASITYMPVFIGSNKNPAAAFGPDGVNPEKLSQVYSLITL